MYRPQSRARAHTIGHDTAGLDHRLGYAVVSDTDDLLCGAVTGIRVGWNLLAKGS